MTKLLLNGSNSLNYIVDTDNISLSVFQVGVIWSGALILSAILDPSSNAIRILNPEGTLSISTMGTASSSISIFAIIGILATFLVEGQAHQFIIDCSCVNHRQLLHCKRLLWAIV